MPDRTHTVSGYFVRWTTPWYKTLVFGGDEELVMWSREYAEERHCENCPEPRFYAHGPVLERRAFGGEA